MLAVLLLAASSGVLLSYYDKKGVCSGISKLQYIFLKMIALVPFVALLFFFYPFKLEVNVFSILLVVALLLVNLTNYLGFVGVVKKTTPFETGVFLTLSIPFIYLIDVALGIKTFSVLSLLILFVLILGVFIMSKKQINVREFKFSLITAVLSAVAKGYLIYFLLQYVSIPVYLLIIHMTTAFIIYLFFNKPLKMKELKSKDYKWAFITQFIGVFSLAFNAMLASNSVSLYILRTPLIIIVSVISSYFIKNPVYGSKPTITKLLGVFITLASLVAFLLL